MLIYKIKKLIPIIIGTAIKAFIKFKEVENAVVSSFGLSAINEWTKENRHEFIIVWPSDESINYYKKNGYVHCTEPMEYFPS